MTEFGIMLAKSKGWRDARLLEMKISRITAAKKLYALQTRFAGAERSRIPVCCESDRRMERMMPDYGRI